MTKKRTIHSWSIYVSYQRQTNHTHTQTQGNGQTFRLDESLIYLPSGIYIDIPDALFIIIHPNFGRPIVICCCW